MMKRIALVLASLALASAHDNDQYQGKVGRKGEMEAVP